MRNINKVLTAGFVLAFLVLLCKTNNLIQAGSVAPTTGGSAEITYIEGKVEVQKSGENWKEATIGTQLTKDDKVRTGEESLAEIKLDDGSIVKLGEETTINILSLEEVGPTKEKVSLFNLIIGEIKAKVLKIFGKQAKFEVQTSACIAGVRGTDFGISAEADEAADVETYEGIVVVEGINEKGERGAPLEIKPNFSTRIEKGKAPLPAQKIEAYRKARWQLWEEKRELFKMAEGLEKIKIAAGELRDKYSLAKTDEEKKEIEKEAQKLKAVTIKIIHDMDKTKKESMKNKEKFDKEVAKASEKWKTLSPEQRAKTRMNYEIWKKTAPRLASIRKEQLRAAAIRWKNMPPEAKARMIRAFRLWKNLPPGQRKVIIVKVRNFRKLPPWVQKKTIVNYRKWKSLPPGQRKKIVDGYKRWRNLPPETRENVKDRLEKFKKLPPDKKQQMLKSHKEWQKIPPQQRREWMKRYREKHPGTPRTQRPSGPKK